MDEELQRAIAQSIATKSPHDRTYEPIARLDQRVREMNQMTGLRNIGNTCYFNSLLQIYFATPSFVEKILKFKVQMPPSGNQLQVHQQISSSSD